MTHIIRWTKVNNTYGVLKILAFNNKPSEISSDLILALKDRYETKTNTIRKENLKKGDAIKINLGPFSELIAKVENVEKNNRIWVLLESMGGVRRLKLQNVEKTGYRKVKNNEIT